MNPSLRTPQSSESGSGPLDGVGRFSGAQHEIGRQRRLGDMGSSLRRPRVPLFPILGQLSGSSHFGRGPELLQVVFEQPTSDQDHRQ